MKIQEFFTTCLLMATVAMTWMTLQKVDEIGSGVDYSSIPLSKIAPVSAKWMTVEATNAVARPAVAEIEQGASFDSLAVDETEERMAMFEARIQAMESQLKDISEKLEAIAASRVAAPATVGDSLLDGGDLSNDFEDSGNGSDGGYPEASTPSASNSLSFSRSLTRSFSQSRSASGRGLVNRIRTRLGGGGGFFRQSDNCPGGVCPIQ